MVQNPQFLINIRKNINTNNPGYGKYYPKAVEKETITLRGLAKHMSEHQCVYSRDIIEGVNYDNITSRAFKDQCSLATYGVEEKIDITPEEQDPTKKEYIKKVTPLDDWIREQTAAANGGASGGNGGGSGNGDGNGGGGNGSDGLDQD